MSDRDFEIGTRKFKLHKLGPIKQFHLMRKLTPILESLIPTSIKLSKSKQSADAQFEALIPIMNGISKLSDQDANQVLFGLLESAEMQQAAGNWARIVSDQVLLFDDLDLPILMQIAGRAFEFNLKGFLAGNPQASHARG